MAKKNGSARFVQHLQSLGFETVDSYLEWCREHEFEANTRKSRGQVCCEVAQVKNRQCRELLVKPQPVEIDWVDWLRQVIDGTRTVRPAREEQVLKKRQVWLSMPEEWRWGLSDKTRAADRGALLDLVDVVGARARFLLEGEEMAGHRCHYMKKDSKGYKSTWVGYKLHIDVADGQIPISCLLTSASLHDSQAAIPLATLSAERTTNLYDVMDAAYDAEPIRQHKPLTRPRPVD